MDLKCGPLKPLSSAVLIVIFILSNHHCFFSLDVSSDGTASIMKYLCKGKSLKIRILTLTLVFLFVFPCSTNYIRKSGGRLCFPCNQSSSTVSFCLLVVGFLGWANQCSILKYK